MLPQNSEFVLAGFDWCGGLGRREELWRNVDWGRERWEREGLWVDKHGEGVGLASSK